MNNKTTKRKDKKEFGVISLGRMCGDLALQAIEKMLARGRLQSQPGTNAHLGQERIGGCVVSGRVGRQVEAPLRIVLIYAPHGDPTRQMIAELKGCLQKGDVVGPVIRSWLVELMERSLRENTLDEAAYATGMTLLIDGGMTLYSSFLWQA